MKNDSPPGRVGALLDRAVHDREGTFLGRVADIVTDTDPDGRERVVALVITRGPWGRLLGYEHDEHTGPWLLEWLARRCCAATCDAWPGVDEVTRHQGRAGVGAENHDGPLAGQRTRTNSAVPRRPGAGEAGMLTSSAPTNGSRCSQFGGLACRGGPEELSDFSCCLTSRFSGEVQCEGS